MLARKQVARGFTLVEILIVVVILGILAAIVIPQFTSASETAKASSLQTQLQTMRSQLELYQVQHNGNYPTLASLNTDADGDGDADWVQLTTQTDVDGAAGTDFGPYLQQAPSNPFVTSTGGANVSVADISGGDAFSATDGWGYNAATGVIKAMVPATVDEVALGVDDDNDFIPE